MANYTKKIKKELQNISLIFFLLSLVSIPAFAYEDCLVTTNGKLTEIRVENHEIIDVYPLITIMNDRNTLFVHPLKSGETGFSVLKNNKDIIYFNVKVNQDKTIIDTVKGFEVLSIDAPPEIYEYELDFPPLLQGRR